MTERTVTTDQIVRAVNLANDLRRAMGIELIDKLPQGIPSDPRRCILAKAFNFDCAITPGIWGEDGRAWFAHQAEAEQFAKLVGREVEVFRNYPVLSDDTDICYRVNIPAEISDIANAFDERLLKDYEASERYADTD